MKIIFLIASVACVSGQNGLNLFFNKARDTFVNSTRNIFNRSIKVDGFVPVRTTFPKAVNRSPIFELVNFSKKNDEKNDKGNKTLENRQTFLDVGDVIAYGNFRACTTPSGQNGKCSDLAACPVLLLDLTSLRKSICFQNLFTPGVCCPVDESEPELFTKKPNRRKTTTTTTTTTTSTTTTTQRPFILDILHFITSRPSTSTTTTRTTVAVQPDKVILEEDTAFLSNEIIQDNGQSFKNKGVCGHVTIATLRIVGGEVSRVGEWPWMTAIYLTGPNGREYWCGGSLITSKHVLTAAHCTQDGKQKRFDTSQFSVELGRTNLITGDTSKMQSYRVKEVRVHPNFRAHGFYNDVAVFTLDGKAKYTDYVRPVCLPSIEDDEFSLVGEIPTVTGFGATDYGGRESNILREVQIPVWRNEDCDRAYIQPITDIFVCAGYADGGKDACQGDSGGPLQLYKNGNWVQIGLVSFGNKCAEPGYPGVYTRLTKFARWIEANSIP